MMRVFLLAVLLFVPALAQEQGTWTTGSASATGTDLRRMRIEAIKRARAAALNQAGIVVSASSFRVQTEKNKEMNDYYSQFTEATSRGIITKERNVTISDPKRVTGVSANSDALYQVDAQLEAFIIIPEGAADPGFSVTLKPNRTSFRESDPVQMQITSSKPGFLTILHVKNDTIQVMFPNALNKGNGLQAKTPVMFPREFEWTLTVDENEKSSTEEFIAVVTKEDIPLIKIGDAAIANGELIVPKINFMELSRWLSSIPLDQRTMDHVVLTVVQ